MARTSTLFALLLVGCGEPTVPVIPQEEPQPAAAVKAADTGGRRHLGRRLDSLEDRISRLELMVAHWVDEGNVDSLHVRYDPRATTLQARTVQDALDEVAAGLKDLQDAGENMGRPGPGMFRIPRDESEMMMGPQGQQAGARPPPVNQLQDAPHPAGKEPPRGPAQPGAGAPGDGSALRAEQERPGDNP